MACVLELRVAAGRPRPRDRPGRPHGACAAHGRARRARCATAAGRRVEIVGPRPRAERRGAPERARARRGRARARARRQLPRRGRGRLVRLRRRPAAARRRRRAADRRAPRRRAPPIVRLEGVADREDAEALRGAALELPVERLPEPEEDAFFVFDLVGCEVVAARAGRSAWCARCWSGPANDVLVRGRRDGASCSCRSRATRCRRSTSPRGGSRSRRGLLDEPLDASERCASSTSSRSSRTGSPGSTEERPVQNALAGGAAAAASTPTATTRRSSTGRWTTRRSAAAPGWCCAWTCRGGGGGRATARRSTRCARGGGSSRSTRAAGRSTTPTRASWPRASA